MTYNELRSNNARRFNALNAQQQQSARDAGYRNRGKLAAIKAAAAILDNIERTIAMPVAVLEAAIADEEAAIARLDSASNRIVNARSELKAEADAAIARLNAIADNTDTLPDEALAIAAPLQPAPESEDVPFRDWECRPSPGCGPLVEAIAHGWNRHWHAYRSARQQVADAISQRIDRTLERLYPAPL